jgi:hypothetical protein
MEGTNIGSIFASITLDTKPLTAGISLARSALVEMAGSFLCMIPANSAWAECMAA